MVIKTEAMIMTKTITITTAPMTAVLPPLFQRSAEKAGMDDATMLDMVTAIASSPEAGDVIPGTGGVRKIRFPAPGRGKSGGYRIIYFYHDNRIPILMLAAYTKSQKSDLSPEGKKVVAGLVQQWITEKLKE